MPGVPFVWPPVPEVPLVVELLVVAPVPPICEPLVRALSVPEEEPVLFAAAPPPGVPGPPFWGVFRSQPTNAKAPSARAPVMRETYRLRISVLLRKS